MRRPALVSTLLAISGVLGAASYDKVIDLRYVPAPKIQQRGFPRGTGVLSTPLNIQVVGSPSGQQFVGENREHKTPVHVRATQDVSEHVAGAFKTTFSEWGGKASGDAPLTLEIEVVRLFVVETQRYQGEARVHFALFNRRGEKLWDGVEAGTSRRFGRSLSEDNYNETMSDALAECFNALAADEGFLAAWAGRSLRPPAPSSEPSETRPTREGLMPADLKTKLVELVKQGFSEDFLVAYVRQTKLAIPLTSDDMVDWKQSGISDGVLKAALEAAR